MAIIIKPIVKGSFRNLVLIKANTADRTIRMVMMLKISID
jgi:hypothetical protein